MDILISLDYEPFLGKVTKDIEKGLISPTETFLKIFQRHQLQTNFFIDAGYLYALDRQRHKIKDLDLTYGMIVRQIERIEAQKHEIGYHLHPHWEDCYFMNGAWHVNTKRYKLSDYDYSEARQIFRKYYYFLQGLTNRSIKVYRAGGWCLEPFNFIRESMLECGIVMDSTVFENGVYHSKTHSFDFRGYPGNGPWRFSDSPSIPDANGPFIEFPITSHRVSPLYYWKALYKKLWARSNYKGHGAAVPTPLKYLVRKLSKVTTDAVSIDSIKSGMLLKSFINSENQRACYFSLMGHPKCFDSRTYRDLDAFLSYALDKGHSIGTYSALLNNYLNLCNTY